MEETKGPVGEETDEGRRREKKGEGQKKKKRERARNRLLRNL